MTETDIKQAVYEALTDHLQDRGCHNACRLTDDDVVFFKRFKGTFDGAVRIVGTAVVMGVLGAVAFVIKVGVEAWRRGQ